MQGGYQYKARFNGKIYKKDFLISRFACIRNNKKSYS
jgi:hypothetical protein